MWRLLKLFDPETAHNITFFILDKQERWDNFRWYIANKLALSLAKKRMRKLRDQIPLV